MALKQGYEADEMATKKKNRRGSEQSYYKAPLPFHPAPPLLLNNRLY